MDREFPNRAIVDYSTIRTLPPSLRSFVEHVVLNAHNESAIGRAITGFLNSVEGDPNAVMGIMLGLAAAGRKGLCFEINDKWIGGVFIDEGCAAMPLCFHLEADDCAFQDIEWYMIVDLLKTLRQQNRRGVEFTKHPRLCALLPRLAAMGKELGITVDCDGRRINFNRSN